MTLHSLIRKDRGRDKRGKYYDTMESYGQMTPEQESKYDNELFTDWFPIDYKAYSILNKADIICTTCITSFDKRLRNFTFETVLIDEATQACEPESILPLLKGANHVILVGDHCQLGPVIMHKQTVMAGLNMSLFERLIRMGHRPLRLQIQYRMHPTLSVFPSDTFYEGSLQNGVSAAQRTIEDFDFPWPDPKNPMFFLHTTGTAELSGSGTSYLNRNEAVNVEVILSYLHQCGKTQKLKLFRT